VWLGFPRNIAAPGSLAEVMVETASDKRATHNRVGSLIADEDALPPQLFPAITQLNRKVRTLYFAAC
jgi:hypothetical protein